MDQRGFTIVEILIVILITGILAGVALPRLGASTADRDVDIAARALTADLRWMQQRSINASAGSANPFVAPDPLPSIQFYNATPSGYFITLYDNATHNTQTIKSVVFPAGVKVNTPPAAFSFGINGYITPTLTIYLECANSFRNVIIDSPGRIRVSSP